MHVSSKRTLRDGSRIEISPFSLFSVTFGEFINEIYNSSMVDPYSIMNTRVPGPINTVFAGV